MQKAGLYVVGIAGAGCPIVSSLGADEVIDYRGKSMADLSVAISQAAGGKLRHALDCVSEDGTLETIAEAFKNGGKATYVLLYSDDFLSKLPASLEHSRTMVAEAYGADAEFATKWFAKLGEWMEEGTFKAQKVTIIEGGLNGVAEGLRRLKDGEVKSEKFVYRIKETQGL